MSEQQLEAQQPEENQERPDWLPDNFKTPEDLAKSYGELQSKFTQTSQQLRAQQEQLEEVLAKQNEEPAEPQGDFVQASQDQLYAAYEQDPVATMAWLAQQAAQSVVAAQARNNEPDPRVLEAQAQIAGKYAEDQVQARYTDWGNYRDKVAEEIQSNPDLYPEDLFQTPAGIEKALTRAYKAVKLDSLESNSNETLEEQIAAQRLAKQQAQTLSGAAGRPAPTDSWEDRWTEIANAGGLSGRDVLSGK